MKRYFFVWNNRFLPLFFHMFLLVQTWTSWIMFTTKFSIYAHYCWSAPSSFCYWIKGWGPFWREWFGVSVLAPAFWRGVIFGASVLARFLWHERFGASVLARTCWKIYFLAQAFWRRYHLARAFWRERFGAVMIWCERFSAGTIWCELFGSGTI